MSHRQVGRRARWICIFLSVVLSIGSLSFVDGQVSQEGCAQCSLKPPSGQLLPCAAQFQRAGFQPYLTATDCSTGPGPIAQLQNTLAGIKESGEAPDGSSCSAYVERILCNYAVQATKGTSNPSCVIKLMCQFDCENLNKCLFRPVKCDDGLYAAAGTKATDPYEGKCSPASDLVSGSVSSSTGSASHAAPSSTGKAPNAPIFAIARDVAIPLRIEETKGQGSSEVKTITTTMKGGYDFYGKNISSVGVYLGIPYAEPQIQTDGSYDKRWKQPLSFQTLDLVYANGVKSPVAKKAEARLQDIGVYSPTNPQSYAFTEESNKCVQFNPKYNSSSSESERMMGDEDCLYLNVYTPYLNFSSENWNCTLGSCVMFPQPPVGENETVPVVQPLLPVMIYLHGGNYANGSAYDFDALSFVQASVRAESPVIVVTLNYRLGVFGFLALPALSEERNPYQTSGLYGFEDQRVALKWINSTIIKFGGDPFRITLMGDGSGAEMACMHVFSPASADLFQRAIFQGGACLHVYRTLDTAELAGQTYLTHLASTLPDVRPGVACLSQDAKLIAACLRLRSPFELFRSYVNISADRFLDPDAPFMGPLIDGTVFEDYAANAVQSASWNPVPIIMGVNTMEYAPFVGGDNHIRFKTPSVPVAPPTTYSSSTSVSQGSVSSTGASSPTLPPELSSSGASSTGSDEQSSTASDEVPSSSSSSSTGVDDSSTGSQGPQQQPNPQPATDSSSSTGDNTQIQGGGLARRLMQLNPQDQAEQQQDVSPGSRHLLQVNQKPSQSSTASNGPTVKPAYLGLADLTMEHVADYIDALFNQLANEDLPRNTILETTIDPLPTDGTFTLDETKPATTDNTLKGYLGSLWTALDKDRNVIEESPPPPFNVDPLRGGWTEAEVLRVLQQQLYADPTQINRLADTIIAGAVSSKVYCQQRRILQLIADFNEPRYGFVVDPEVDSEEKAKWAGKFRYAWLYRFSYVSHQDDAIVYQGAVQNTFLQYLAGVPSPNQFHNRTFTSTDLQISRDIQYYWLNFLYNGYPYLYEEQGTSKQPLKGAWHEANLHFSTGEVSDAPSAWLPSIRTFGGQEVWTLNFNRHPNPSLDPPVQVEVLNIPDADARQECFRWNRVEHPGGNNYYYTPREPVEGQKFEQYYHCFPLSNTSYCYGLLDYTDVNLLAPFTCQADVEHFLIQVPNLIAGLKSFIDHPEDQYTWPYKHILDALGIPTTDRSTYIQPCMDAFAHATCRLLYRPCKMNETTVTQTTTTNGTDPLLIKKVNSLPGWTANPCASVCHNYRHYCPYQVATYLIAPVFDLFLPLGLNYDDIFRDCTNEKYWNATVTQSSTQNCTIVTSFFGGDSLPYNPPQNTTCECIRPMNTTSQAMTNKSLVYTDPRYEWFTGADRIKQDQHPKYPTCQEYKGKVCEGIITYSVYVPWNSSMAALEQIAMDRQLIALQRLAPKQSRCREYFARQTCASIFLQCNNTVQYKTLEANKYDVELTHDYAVPYPQFPCQSVCKAAYDTCAVLFKFAQRATQLERSASVNAAALVDCKSDGKFWPKWDECPDPVFPDSTRVQLDLQGLFTQPVDYPEGDYPLIAWKTGDFVTNLYVSCNNFLNVSYDQMQKVKVTCPYPLVIPSNEDAPTYADGSCSAPCASILWTAEQWSIGDGFFNIVVVVGFIMSLWLAVSYTLFPVNRQRAYLHMFFISIFCLSTTYLMQILYSKFTPHLFGCKSVSEISRQSDDILCTLAGSSFIYFINASVQWWMVISLDFFNSLVRKKKYTVKQLTVQRIIYHILAWGMPLIFVIVAAGTQALGRDSTVPWCFMTDDTAPHTEWGIMWIPLAVRLFLGMAFMFYVARTMYQQGGEVERRGTGDRWGWFKMQGRYIALVVFFCFVFLWLIVYRAYMLFSNDKFAASTEEYIVCLLYDAGNCGEKPKVYPVSLIWYGMIGCVGAQGIACGLFYGFERRNAVLWSGFLQGKGRDYFTKPDVDTPSRAEKGGGTWTDTPTNKLSSTTKVTAISSDEIAIQMKQAIKKGNKKKVNGTTTPHTQQHYRYS